MLSISDFFTNLQYSAPAKEVGALLVYMVAGGLLGFYIRALYLRFANTVSNRDKFSLTFPTVILATVLVIFVIKSSLALSLGLVGALSIVRFRAAIKEPEEIVYLFFCIAVGLSLGAEYFAIAVGGVAAFTLFVIIGHQARRKRGGQSMLLTVRGPLQALFDGDLAEITRTLSEIIGPMVVQRLEVDGDYVQCRVTLSPENQDSIGAQLSALQKKLPGCQLSYVNLENMM